MPCAVQKGTSALRWLSLVVAAILVVWILAARYAGLKFEELDRARLQTAA